MPRPRHFVFVCTNERPPDNPKSSCKARGSQAVFDTFKSEIKARDLKGEIIVAPSGCLGTCYDGPTVAVYPEGIFYGKVTPETARKIIDEHLVGGRPVEKPALGDKAWD